MPLSKKHRATERELCPRNVSVPPLGYWIFEQIDGKPVRVQGRPFLGSK